MNERSWCAAVFAAWLLAISPGAFGAENLVIDASFESPLPSWFAERSGTSYFAAKEQVDGAAEGSGVLAIEGWDARGSKILSPPIRLPGGEAAAAVLSATASVRCYGGREPARLELALFDEKGAVKLASFGQVAIDDRRQWHTLARAAVRLDRQAAVGRLALVPSGPQEDARVEVDCVGLFAGDTLGPAAGNEEVTVVEAEELADGKCWKVVDHYGGWYHGTPSARKMLAGFDAVKPEENRPVTRKVTMHRAGHYTLWVRFQAGTIPGKFTVGLRQNGQTAAEKEFVEDAVPDTHGYTWVWQPVPADLQPGDAEIVLSRPPGGASWVTRKLDLFVLTDRPDYVPRAEDFQPRAYLRFTNLSEGLEPFCLWIWIRRHQGPHWYANPGVLSRAGLSESFYVPHEKDKWLASGGHSPWVRVSDYLLDAGGRNNVQIIATRKGHTEGFVEGRVRGRLELAVGPRHTVVKTIDVDQPAPRLVMTLPFDLQSQPGEIKAAIDYVRETEAVMARLGPPPGPLAQSLNLSAILGLQAGLDDPEVLRREIGILKGLGFNQPYTLIAPPEQVAEFHRADGLVPRFGLMPTHVWADVQHHSQHHPDQAAMRGHFEKLAEENRPILDRCVRLKLMDEPGAMSYESIADSEPCRQKFKAWLQGQGLTPQQLGVKSWDEVRPVLPADRREHPELFYHSGIFRLEGFATLARACVEAKLALLPDNVLTFVNYSPPNSGGSWTHRGTDLFLAHGSGGMEMVWTEDWLGYSLGPQHLSDMLALCRAAGKSQNRRIGAYWVGDCSPELLRMKFYTLLAGGARDITSYSYGPWYAGIDSWGRRFDLYPAIRACQFEAAAIDAALDGTVRRKTDIAILYNRTASIWADDDNPYERNASFTHWALAHAGYDADFLSEEDVAAGRLAEYKLFYVDGPQVIPSAAQAMAAWVKQGGVLVGSAGAASRDPYDRPLEVLAPVFGAKSAALEQKGKVGRPRYDTRSLKPLAALTTTPQAGTPGVAFGQLAVEERIEPAAGSTAILVDASGQTAGVMNRFGQGTAIRLAALPGLSYAHGAIQPPYDIDSYLPKRFRPELRDFLAWPAVLARASRVAATDCPIAEIVRYDASDRAVVFVVDHRAEPVGRFEFTLPGAARFDQATAATGARVELRRSPGGALIVSLPLNLADAVVLRGDSTSPRP